MLPWILLAVVWFLGLPLAAYFAAAGGKRNLDRTDIFLCLVWPLTVPTFAVFVVCTALDEFLRPR